MKTKTYQHRDVSERRLEGFIQNIGNLVLEILSSNQRIDQVLSALTQHSVNFTTSTSEILVIVEGLPQSENRLRTRLSTGIEKHANLGVKNTAKSIEEPSVRIDLLGVLLFQAEHHLDGWQARWVVIARADELLIRGNGQLCGVFELRSR